MTYASIGLIALLVQLIINHDVFRKGAANDRIAAHQSYRRFLLGVMFYYITDILWGVLDVCHWIGLLYADSRRPIGLAFSRRRAMAQPHIHFLGQTEG